MDERRRRAPRARRVRRRRRRSTRRPGGSIVRVVVGDGLGDEPDAIVARGERERATIDCREEDTRAVVRVVARQIRRNRAGSRDGRETAWPVVTRVENHVSGVLSRGRGTRGGSGRGCAPDPNGPFAGAPFATRRGGIAATITSRSAPRRGTRARGNSSTTTTRRERSRTSGTSTNREREWTGEDARGEDEAARGEDAESSRTRCTSGYGVYESRTLEGGTVSYTRCTSVSVVYPVYIVSHHHHTSRGWRRHAP